MTADEKISLKLAYQEAMRGTESPNAVVMSKEHGWEIILRQPDGSVQRRYTEDINDLP